jgi:hypothetical protein
MTLCSLVERHQKLRGTTFLYRQGSRNVFCHEGGVSYMLIPVHEICPIRPRNRRRYVDSETSGCLQTAGRSEPEDRTVHQICVLSLHSICVFISYQLYSLEVFQLKCYTNSSSFPFELHVQSLWPPWFDRRTNIVTWLNATVEGVWIGNRIYWTLTTRRYTLQIIVTHRLTFWVCYSLQQSPGNGSQRRTFPFLWVPNSPPATTALH